MSRFELSGRRVWITGASRGLGRALALALAREGALLALSGRDTGALEESARLCREAGAAQVVVIRGDVTDAAACMQAVEQIVAALGGLDVLVANAGISMWTRFEEVRDPAIFGRLMEVNYLGVVYCVRAALPQLRANQGMIVNISSAQAWTGMAWHTGYSASKAAAQIFLDALSMEVSDISILGVYPGWISGTELRASALGADGATRGESRKSHNRLSVPAAECSRRIVHAMQRRKSTLFIPGYMRLLQVLRPVAFPLIKWALTKALGSQKGR